MLLDGISREIRHAVQRLVLVSDEVPGLLFGSEDLAHHGIGGHAACIRHEHDGRARWHRKRFTRQIPVC